MPDEEKNEIRRRILDVDVNEVSLVDRAANLRRFLVVKRNDEEDEKMGAFKTDEEIKKAKQAEEDEEEKKKAKAKEEEEMKKAKAKEEEEEKEKKAKEEEEEKLKKMLKAMNPKAIAGMLRGLKGAPKGVKEVIDWLDAQKAANPDDDEEEPADKKIKKSAGETPAVQVMEDGTVVVSGQPVHKGKKFTASRTNAIKDVTLTLLKLIGEVDPDTMKSIEEAMKELPKDPKWTQGVKPVGTGDGVKLGKGEEEDDEEKTKLKKEVADLTKRLEKIEEERPVTKSLEEEGGTDVKIKKDEGLWDNIL